MPRHANGAVLRRTTTATVTSQSGPVGVDAAAGWMRQLVDTAMPRHVAAALLPNGGGVCRMCNGPAGRSRRSVVDGGQREAVEFSALSSASVRQIA